MLIASTSKRLSAFERLSKIKAGVPSESGEPNASSSQTNNNDEFDAFVTAILGGDMPGTSANLPLTSFLQQLNALDFEPHQNMAFDPWKHWISRKHTHPMLSEIALCLLAVPSNQVTVERAFSAFGLIFTDMRTKLSEDVLENLLILKLNRDVLEKILPHLYDWKSDNII